MKNKINKIFDIFLPIYVIINLILILIGSYLVLKRYIYLKTFSYLYIILLILNVIITIILLIRKKYKKNKIDIFLILILLFSIISSIFAKNIETAIFGSWERYEGIFVICYYFTILFLTSFIKKEYKKKIIYSILVFGLIQCIYAICQKLNLFNAETMLHNGFRWATGFTGNPNFLGTLMLICICYSIGLYIDSNDKIKMILLLSLIFIFSIGILLSKTRSCMIGLIFVMIILLIYSIKNKYIKKYIVLSIILVISTIFMQVLNLTPVIGFISEATEEISDISKGNGENFVADGRLYIWKETIKRVPNYLLHGIGIDNFSYIKDGGPIYSLGLIVDKAHNEYLQILITTGIFSLISYLCLHFLIIKEGLKNAFKSKEIYLILPVIGYLVQAQFNISVITVAPIFYISLGLLMDRN